MNVRVYYNQNDAFPQIWSVDEGTVASEIHVQNVVVKGVLGTTGYDKAAPAGNPKAWMQFNNVLVSFKGGVAIIEPQKA